MNNNNTIANSFEPGSIEKEIYQSWEENNYFDSTPKNDEQGFCILLPPPNVTGSLHMGHAFQHVVMDALTRYHRMCGKNSLWQPGTDHAGVGTHIVVSKILRGQGIDPEKLSREDFLEKVLAWKDQSASMIGSQMRRLGDSCDWSRECFTLDPALSKVVRDVFIKLYEDGLIYRGKRLVNWDPKLLTALADLEVVSAEEDSLMYHIRYPFVDPNDGDGMIIATTRPETILVDGALAVAPNDERYQKQVGKFVRVPCTSREIEVIEDQHVDPEFGSGCVKITPAHDFNDYEVAKRHPDKNIPEIELMTPEAILNENAPKKYQGLDRFTAREAIVNDLEQEGLLVKKEPHKYMLPRGERSGVVVEPMLSDQWYVKTDELAKLALDAVHSKKLQFVPSSWQNVYENWLSNIKDWCISRQIDWGHPIPAYLDEDNNVYVAESLVKAQEQAGSDKKLTQIPDVLDTWFSSALWPLSTLGWPDVNNSHFKSYFPTSVLVTGNDIIFFWVARMVMMSQYLVNDVPFREVYMHGLVRDKYGNKMSKSRGNVLDPIDLIEGISLEDLLAKRITPDLSDKQKKNIEKFTKDEFPAGIPPFGVDALRLTFASLASHGRNINFDIGRIDGHKRLCNKLWQSARFILQASENFQNENDVSNLNFADKWIISRLHKTTQRIIENIKVFRLDLVVEELTSLLRDDFCDWYIEISKEYIDKDNEQAQATKQTLLYCFINILKLAHPIIPFITAKLYQAIGPLVNEVEDIIVAKYPSVDESKFNIEAELAMQQFQEIVHAIRSLRVNINFPPGQKIDCIIETNLTHLQDNQELLIRLARLNNINFAKVDPKLDEPIIELKETRMQIIIGATGVNWREQLQSEIAKQEKAYQKLKSKLDNPNFVNNAPSEIVEQQKLRVKEQQERLAAIQELIK